MLIRHTGVPAGTSQSHGPAFRHTFSKMPLCKDAHSARCCLHATQGSSQALVRAMATARQRPSNAHALSMRELLKGPKAFSAALLGVTLTAAVYYAYE